MKRICLFCGSNAGSRSEYAQAAAEFGRVVAANGLGLIYGGGSVGLMKIAAEAALAAKGEVIGVITEQLMVREVGHPGLSELTVVPTMHDRKARMASLADAFVALPGGFGTFDELCEMATWDQLGIHRKPLVLVNVLGYFDAFLAQLDRGVADGFLRPEHRRMVEVVSDAHGVIGALARWQPPPVAGWLVDEPPKP
jgi:uncharacterized protein (TIGR00730 family)